MLNRVALNRKASQIELLFGSRMNTSATTMNEAVMRRNRDLCRRKRISCDFPEPLVSLFNNLEVLGFGETE